MKHFNRKIILSNNEQDPRPFSPHNEEDEDLIRPVLPHPPPSRIVTAQLMNPNRHKGHKNREEPSHKPVIHELPPKQVLSPRLPKKREFFVDGEE